MEKPHIYEIGQDRSLEPESDDGVAKVIDDLFPEKKPKRIFERIDSLHVEHFMHMLESLTTVPRNHNAIAKRQELVREYTDRQLINAIHASNEQDWMNYPSYYCALAAEIERRDLAD